MVSYHRGVRNWGKTNQCPRVLEPCFPKIHGDESEIFWTDFPWWVVFLETSIFFNGPRFFLVTRMVQSGSAWGLGQNRFRIPSLKPPPWITHSNHWWTIHFFGGLTKSMMKLLLFQLRDLCWFRCEVGHLTVNQQSFPPWIEIGVRITNNYLWNRKERNLVFAAGNIWSTHLQMWILGKWQKRIRLGVAEWQARSLDLQSLVFHCLKIPWPHGPLKKNTDATED